MAKITILPGIVQQIEVPDQLKYIIDPEFNRAVYSRYADPVAGTMNFTAGPYIDTTNRRADLKFDIVNQIFSAAVPITIGGVTLNIETIAKTDDGRGEITFTKSSDDSENKRFFVRGVPVQTKV